MSVFELIAAGTSLREPYPASSTAIRAQFAVAGCSGGASDPSAHHSPGTSALNSGYLPSIVEIVTSAATHAVMAVTGLRFLVGTASLGRWGSQDLFIKLVLRSIRHPARLWQYVRAKPAYQLTYKPQPVGGVNQLSEPFNHCTPGRKQITASPTSITAQRRGKRACYAHRPSFPEIA